MSVVSRLGVVLALMVTLLVAAGGSVADAADNTCPFDDAQRDYNCPLGPNYVIPGLTDLNGWKDRAHYRNILVGDIDGDKVDEMVVRGVGGIQVFRFDRSVGQWTQVKVAPILPDGGGWGARPYYDTIRLGDIDGKPGAELIARSGDGILVFKYQPTSPDVGSWQQVTTSGPFKDTDCWYPPQGGARECWNSDPSYYSTIQLTTLGADQANPHMQLIGRGRDGLEFYSWNGSGWTKNATLGAAGDTNTKFRDDPAYYSTILPLSNTDVLVQGARGMQVYRYNGAWSPQGSPAPFTAPQPQSSYSTLQLFRGLAGGPVVLRRGSAGAQLWQWNGSGWNALAGGDLPFSNADGWTQPQYYRTLQAADIDGDGLDEILSRTASGMYAYRFNASTKRWIGPISALRPRLADSPWVDPAYYTTIKTARLDPKGPARSLLARGPTGVRTWYFDPRPGAQKWTRYQRYGFPPLPAKAYASMNSLLGFVGGGKIRDQYATNPDSQTVAGWLNAITATCTGPSAPKPLEPTQYASCTHAGVSAGDWTTVANQILAELYWSGQANAYFTKLSGIQTVVQADQKGEFSSITDDLKLKEAENVAAPSINFLNLFEGIMDILAEIPEVGELFGVTGGALGIADAASPTLAKQPTAFDKKISELQTTLTTIQEEAEDAISDHRRYALGDWGLMRTVGRLQASLLWQLDPLAARSASRQGFAQWIYSQYVPTIWDSWTVDHCRTHWGCAEAGPLMKYWTDIGEDQDGYEEARFQGLLPRQRPCGDIHCEWASLESKGYSDLITKLTSPISPDCIYDPKSTSTPKIWDFRCNLGYTGHGLPFKFRTYNCDYSVQWNDDRYCWNVQDQYGVVAGAARGVGTGRGVVDMTAVAPLRRDLDLRRGKITLARLLHEGGGESELVNSRRGKNFTPRTLRLKRGGKRHRARFETPPGTRPRIRGTLTVNVHKVRVRRPGSKKTRIRRVYSLGVRMHVDRASLDRPRRCGARATHLGVHLLVSDRKGRRGQLLETVPWACPKGGRMRYRAARARARVSTARATVKGGTASIPLRCNRGRLGCRGVVSLFARTGGTRQAVAGRKRFAIGPGRSAKVRVRLGRRTRGALAANGRLVVTASAVTSHPLGPPLRSRRNVVLSR